MSAEQATLFGAPVTFGEAGVLEKSVLPLLDGSGAPYSPASGDRVRITLDAIMVPTTKPEVDPETGAVSIHAAWTARPILATVIITETGKATRTNAA